MSKISLIIQREYLTRVRKKSFIIFSILTPFIMLLLIALPALITLEGSSSGTKVAVLDATGAYADYLESGKAVVFTTLTPDTNADDLRANYSSMGFDAYLHITARPDSSGATLYSESGLPFDVVFATEDGLTEGLRKRIIAENGGSAELDSIVTVIGNAKANVITKQISEDGAETESVAGIAMAVSMIAALFLYVMVLLSGAMVQASVIEEKQTRIVEVLASTVKPIELMLGKIISVALVSLTQVVIWIGTGVSVFLIASVVFAPDPETVQQMVSAAADAQGADAAMAAAADSNVVMTQVQEVVASLNVPFIVTCFIVYFLGGYFLYASLFAISGVSVDNASEGSQFQFVIMLPIFAALYLSMHAAQDPASTLSFWGSMIPLTSPMVMMARLPFGVPAWELALSFALLFGCVALFAWVAARVYRVGILMYGKKATFSEIFKWFKQKE